MHNVPTRTDCNTVTDPRRCDFIAATNIFASETGLISKRLLLVIRISFAKWQDQWFKFYGC